MANQSDVKPARHLQTQRQKVRSLTEAGMLLALTMTLAWFESVLPPPPTPIPLRYGLANIVLMYALLCDKKKLAGCLLIGKVLFVLLMRGPLASVLSLSGSGLAFLWMLSALLLWQEKISYLVLSTVAAVLHNIGQLVVVSLFFIGPDWLFIYPYLLVTGSGMGILTAGILFGLSKALPSRVRLE